MYYGDDAFATMLLTVSLSPNRAEYVRPLSTPEYRRISQRAGASSVGRLGGLLGVDISGVMQLLAVPEEEAYRIFTLLNRGVQLSYALEAFEQKGIQAFTCFDNGYPQKLKSRMEAGAPPSLFFAGNRALFDRPAISVIGVSGIKTTPEVRQSIEAIVLGAKELGFPVIAGGELGVSRVAEGLILEHGGKLIVAVAGGLQEHALEETVAKLLADGRAALLSVEHPESLFTIPHAIARNKIIFALSQAAFVFNTDGKRGETDALKNRLCNWIYAHTGCPANRALVSRGAVPFGALDLEGFRALSEHWKGTGAEQINLFDLL